MELTGYLRPDGRVGFRNLIAVVPLSGCVQEIARRIADGVDGAVALWQLLGCDLCGQDQERLGQMLYQLATHPNVGAAIFVTMGCAATNAHLLPSRTAETGRPVKAFNTQAIGGTTACVRAGIEAAQEMAETLTGQARVSVPVSSIVLGTKCGASDDTSYEIGNPALGACCDVLVDMGGTAVLSEDNELYPAVEDLVARAADAETAQRIRDMVDRLAVHVKRRCGIDIAADWGDPEAARARSLARVAKAGTRPISKVFRLDEQIDAQGLVILDGPNSDLISITSMTAAGCNLLAFTTGRGTPIASPLAPTIKITANEATYERMNENIDFLAKPEDVDDGGRMLEAIVAYAAGMPTKGEILGHTEMFIPLEGVTF